jgi:excinuclease ABC subunit C
VILPRNSEALFLLQRLRDEAHRFAITHQRTRRKRDIGSQLSEIPGLGAARVRLLLKHFGSVARLRAATEQEIAEVPGFGAVLAAAVAERLRATEGSGEDGGDDAGEAPEEGDLDAGIDGDPDLSPEDQGVPAGLDGGVLETR